MDTYLSDKRVEAAVNRAVKSITDNPAALERELRDFAQIGEDWRQKSMALEQEKDAIQTKLDKVTKELENAFVANHDVEAKSCLPFLIGKVRQTPLLAFGDSFMKSER
jgi:L-lactate utilization protein LutB